VSQQWQKKRKRKRRVDEGVARAARVRRLGQHIGG
jgi:hypothetical protein